MTRFGLISVLAFSAAMASSAAAAPGHASITPTEVAAAITDAGMKVTSEQVTFLTDVVAKSDSPSLKVQSMEQWGDHRMKVRLDCDPHEQCMPFFVAVQCSQENEAQQGSLAPGRSSAALLRTSAASGPIVMRAGSQVTLLLDGGHVHIRLSVVCLENGAAGQTIRVASRDHKQTYLGRVMDEAILKGSL